MNMRSVFMGGVAALVALTGTAIAADLPVKAPPMYQQPPIGFSWTGIYIGIHGGFEQGANDITATAASGAASESESLSNTASGGFGGGHIGYNYQMLPQWVVGGRFDIDASGLSGSTTDASGNTFARSVPWHADFVARLGYLVTPQTMLYGVGGVAFGEIKDSAFVPLSRTTSITIEDTNVHTGWVAGVGIEQYLTQSLSIGAEWNYFDLGTHGVAFVGTPPAVGAAAPTFNTNDKAAWNAFKVFGSLKF